MAPKAKAAAPAAAAPKAKSDAKPKAKPKAEKAEEEKIVAPDRTEHEAALAVVAEKIVALQKEQAAIATQIAERSGGKDEYQAKRMELRAQLDMFSEKIDALMESKGEINKAVSEKRQDFQDMRSQLNKMKKSIGYTSEGAIDDRIQEIEYKLVTDTMSLKEEKELLKEISDLKRNKPKVTQVNRLEDSLQNRDTGVHLKENIGSINEQISLYRDGKKKVQEKLAKLQEERKAQTGDLGGLFTERENLNAKIQECIGERQTIVGAFREKEREYNAKRNELRKQRDEQWRKDKEEQQKQWEMNQRKKKADAMDDQPFVSEMTLVEQTIFFCKSLVKEKGGDEKEEKKEIVHNNPEGTEVMVKKEDRDEFYFVPTGKKKGKAKAKAAKEGVAKPIKHNAETFRLFDKLKLDAPITTDDIPATLEKLEAQLETYKEKVKEWEAQRDELKQKILAGDAVDEEEKEEQQEKEEQKEEEQKEEKDE